MDSLTQIILGAAVGQATLGKKVGNRAMAWGAIAGTIPDLDVLSRGFMTPINSLAFHRGISHSFVFSVVASIILGYLVHWMYKQSYHKWIGLAAWSILVGGISTLILFLGDFSRTKTAIGIFFLVGFGFVIFRKYFKCDYRSPIASLREWQWIFFLSLVTHPILDCFTTYGTQFLLPFSDKRIAFNNISVADPAYTFPFLICLLIAMFLPMRSTYRNYWNNAGLIISSIYMVFTIFNKFNVNHILKDSLHTEKLAYHRYMSSPTILNNVLWSGIAESDTAYHYGQFSYFDTEKRFKLITLPKNDSTYREAIKNDATLKTLQWFSDGYYLLNRISTDTVEYYDLRFGKFKTKASEPENFVFKFNLQEKPSGKFTLLDQGEGPRDANFGEAFEVLWNRIMGKLD